MRQLSDGILSIADVAHASGYADQAHLTRSFVAAFGFTPARVRARLTSKLFKTPVSMLSSVKPRSRISRPTD
jgi:AraC-like DNA-binding protein